MNIRYASDTDINLLMQHDKHITKNELKNSVYLSRILIAEEYNKFAGWLRYNLFWDNTPFMNMLYILEPYQRKGIGRQLVKFWEQKMLKEGYQTVLTSTQSNEYAQHFYYHLGYEAIGGFRLDGDIYEVIFAKTIKNKSDLIL